MRIVQLIDNLGVGGAEKLQVTLAEAAQERDVELSVINLALKKEQLLEEVIRENGAQVIRLPARKLLDWKAIHRLAKLLRCERFDVLQTHLEYANIMGAVAGQLSSTPVISTLHSAKLHPKHRPMIHKLEAWTLRNVSKRVIAVGQVVADAHRERLAYRSIDVIPNAVASIAPLSEVERYELRYDLWGDLTRPIVISVGRLTEVKGYFDLLDAFVILRESTPQAALMIVGGGHLYDALASKIKALGLSDHIQLLGLRNDVPRLLAASDLYVSASHWEGLPLSVLEAMMAGLPIVATKVGDLPQAVVEGTGVLIDPKSPAQLATALQFFLSHPKRMRAHGRAAKEHATRHHSTEAWFNQLLTLYREVKEIS